MWAEAEFQFVQMDLATILDFYSVWYRDDLVKPRVKLEQLYFGLTGPNGYTYNEFGSCKYVLQKFGKNFC